jgi:ParB-like chromosome segregation protein Spo0J
MSKEVHIVDLEEVFVPQRTWTKLMRKDRGQIEGMVDDFETDRAMVPVVLRPRFGGGYNVEDGRHRVIAAKIAGMGAIEAIIVGD